MSDLGVLVGIPIVCLIVVAVVVAIILLYLRWRRQKQLADSYRDGGTSGRSTHGSSTIRSDQSDHPYENPSLPRKPLGNHGNNNNKNQAKSSLPGDQYASLKGQSLAHHYQGLGEKLRNSRKGATAPREGAALDEDSLYDELVTSTEGTNSDYYFKVEPDSRGGTSKSGSELDKSLSNPNSPYDKVIIGNAGRNATRTKHTANGTLESSSSSNPYYFKVERNASEKGQSAALKEPIKGVEELKTDTNSGSRKSSDTGLPKSDSIDPSAKPPVDSVPDSADYGKGEVSLKTASSYDKLDRAVLRQPPADDHDGTKYNKILPRLANETNSLTQGSSESSGYLSVQVSNELAHPSIDLSNEETDYSKLDRGVERNIRNLHVPDEETSSPPASHEHSTSDDIPVEL